MLALRCLLFGAGSERRSALQSIETNGLHWVKLRSGITSHYVRDTAFAEDASRIRKNPDIAARLRSFAYNLIRADGTINVRNTRWRAALDLNFVLKMPQLT